MFLSPSPPQWRALSLAIYRMVKRARRLASGRGALARLLSAPPPPRGRALALFREWRDSRELAGAFGEYARDPGMDVGAAADAIIAVKGDAGEGGCRAALERCLEALRLVAGVRQDVELLRGTKFDEGVAEHEARLEALWEVLQPGRVREGGRISKDWGHVGFQTKDPKSDFRGGGLLGLEQLLYFARSRTDVARRMLVEPADDAARYPWACAGINVTMKAVGGMMEDGPLDIVLFGGAERVVASGGSAGAMLAVFHGVYADLFERLHRDWVAAEPENVLAFGPIFAETMKRALSELERSGTVCDGSVAVSGGSVSGRKSD
jgi:ELMO/CED-12 family